MKKAKRIAALLAAAMLAILPACGRSAAEMHAQPAAPTASAGPAETEASPEAKDTVTVLTDLSMLRPYVKSIRSFFPEGADVTFSFLPENVGELETAAERVRVEIMAGRGPDAFLLTTGYERYDSDLKRIEPLFADVDKVMRNGVFLPLDRLLEENGLFDPAAQIPAVWEAGQCGGEQIVLPLSFQIPMFLVPREKLRDPDARIDSWASLLESGEEELIRASKKLSGTMQSYYFTRIADYDQGGGTLLLDAETLEARAEALGDTSFSRDADGDPMEMFYSRNLYAAFPYAPFGGSGGPLSEPEKYVLYGLDNADGGLTAMITSYAAVNASSPHAAEVFPYLAVFLNADVQDGRGFAPDGGEDVSRGLFRPDLYLLGCGLPVGKDCAYLAGLEPLIDKIDCARFFSPLDRELSDFFGYEGGAPESGAAERAVNSMKMMLAE